MSHVIEADEQGTIHLPREVTRAKPHEHFRVEVQTGQLVLRPLISYPPNWDKTTPAQRAQDFEQTVRRFPPSAVHLTDEQLRRENLYD